MDLVQSMRVFQCVVDEGGFAAAARKMDLAPTAVTRQIQDLEQLLGARLLHRTTRKMSLTQAGEGYLSRLRLILSEIEEAADQARAHSSEVSGNLRVATTSLVARPTSPRPGRRPQVVDEHAAVVAAHHADEGDACSSTLPAKWSSSSRRHDATARRAW